MFVGGQRGSRPRRLRPDLALVAVPRLRPPVAGPPAAVPDPQGHRPRGALHHGRVRLLIGLADGDGAAAVDAGLFTDTHQGSDRPVQVAVQVVVEDARGSRVGEQVGVALDAQWTK